MISENTLRRFYPDDTKNGTIIFYNLLRQHLAVDSRVLNFGAGPATRNPIRTIRGKVLEVVGADIDPVVLTNAELDRAVILENDCIPIESSYFDVVYSDFVFEHVENPAKILEEIYRVLKPGGWLFFRTPNSFHYVTIISKFTPHSFHKFLANRVRGLGSESHEPWPTHYLLNSKERIQAMTSELGFIENSVRMIEPQPSYLTFHIVPFLFGVLYERMVNSSQLLSGMRATIVGKMRKPVAHAI